MAHTKETPKVVEESDLTWGRLYVLECLKQWGAEKAKELNIPSHNSELVNIAFSVQ